MHNLVIDMTHGGVKIAISLAKRGNIVWVYDIYATLNEIDSKMLDIYGVEVIGLDELSKLKGDIRVIHPVHLPLTHEEIISNNPDLSYTFLTHHEIIKELLADWGSGIAKIEITGVKGKTSCVFMLKEILIDENPLVLSSLGAILYEGGKEYILQRDISITPANIKNTIDLAYKLANPICSISGDENPARYSSAIFESSLGASGIGDVGLLTNIAEDYPIARNRLSASMAKSQIFMCNTVACEKESYDKYYCNVNHEKVNTFSVNDHDADLHAKSVSYTLDESVIDMEYENVKTVTDNEISGEITVKTFAPGEHHVMNTLGVVLTALCLEIPHEKIIRGLENYRGIAGRTNKRVIGESIIIEEINPGINTKAIEESIRMIENLDDYYVAIGGDYGITCEEIDEDKASEFLRNVKCDLILTGDVGKSIYDKMPEKPLFIENYEDCYEKAITEGKNLLFIYRSDYSKVSLR